MGGKAETTGKTDTVSQPWQPAQGALTDILGNLKGITPTTSPTQTAALDTLAKNAQGGNPWAPQIGDVTSGLLAGGPDRTGYATGAYSDLQGRLSSTANGDYLDPNKNPWFAQTTKTIGDDISNRVNSMFAGAGRDMSGYNTQTLSRGLAEGLAPVYGSVYNTERGNQIGAANTLYGAGNATTGLLSGLDQTKFGNQEAGAALSGAALQAQNYGPMQSLLIEGQRQGIPLDMLQKMLGIAGPIAGLGGQVSGTTSGTNTMSGAEQFAKIAGGLGSLMQGGAKVASVI